MDSLIKKSQGGRKREKNEYHKGSLSSGEVGSVQTQNQRASQHKKERGERGGEG